MIRLSVSVPADLNRLIEEWRLYTGNDKVEIIRQILRQWFEQNPLPEQPTAEQPNNIAASRRQPQSLRL